jgi:predicted dehydrogenase
LTGSEIRWGVLGCADIALRRLIPAMQRATGCEVLAIASRDADRAREAASQSHIPRVSGSYAELLTDADVDAVYIPLPNSLHAEWTVRAAEAGKHVLVEKPMALSVTECERMLAAAESAGVHLMEAFMYRFHPQHAYVRDVVASGAIGRVHMLRSTFCARMQRPPTDIRFSRELGGGALLDVGVYAIDAARWLAGGEPLSVSGSAVYDANGVDMSAAAVLTFDDRESSAVELHASDDAAPAASGGLIASVTCSFQAAGGGSYELIGSDGKVTVHQAFPQPPGRPARVTLEAAGSDPVIKEFPSEADQYQVMVEAFCASILTGSPQPFAPDSGVGNIRVIESLRNGTLAPT